MYVENIRKRINKDQNIAIFRIMECYFISQTRIVCVCLYFDVYIACGCFLGIELTFAGHRM